MVFRFTQQPGLTHSSNDRIAPLPLAEGLIVVMGFAAVLLNAAFAFIVLYRKSIRRPINVAAFLLWFNLLLLPVQVWYHFISKM